jgi:tight adherence protein C
MSVAGVLVGLAAGSGLVVTLSRMPPVRRPSLDDRVAPYLRDLDGRAWPETEVARLPLSTLGRLAAPAVESAARRLGNLLGGAASVCRRLAAAGIDSSVHSFRVEQVLAGAAGFGVALALSLLLVAGGASGRPLALLFVCVAGAMAGVLGRDYALSRAVRMRERRLLAEFPVIAELLALAVTAGEGPAAALERVVRTTRGELSTELGRALAETRSGTPLAQALEGIGRRTTLPVLARFTEAFAVAIERGTPLADVLRAQADDVRAAGRRALLESGGRREIAMLIPVVFGILPVTVLFALFPAVLGLTVIVP